MPGAIVVIGGGAEGGKPAYAGEILSLFEGRLARYKHPREVIFVDALPRNVMGKVLKFELREMVAKIDAKRTDG